MSEDSLKDVISKHDTERVDFDVTSKKRSMEFRVKVIAANPTTPTEYLVELYEIHGNGTEHTIIFRNWITLTRPKNEKRIPALSAILGTIVLLGVAASAGGAYYFMAVDRADMIHPYIDISSFDIIRFADDSDSVLVEMRLHTDNPINLTMSGDFVGKVLSNGDCVQTNDIILTDDTGNGVKIGGGEKPVMVESQTRGYTISYEGILHLRNGTSASIITAHIQNDVMEAIHSIGVKP